MPTIKSVQALVTYSDGSVATLNTLTELLAHFGVNVVDSTNPIVAESLQPVVEAPVVDPTPEPVVESPIVEPVVDAPAEDVPAVVSVDQPAE